MLSAWINRTHPVDLVWLALAFAIGCAQLEQFL